MSRAVKKPAAKKTPRKASGEASAHAVAVERERLHAQSAMASAKEAIVRAGLVRGLVDQLYDALVVAYATHEGEPDVDDKSNYADCMLGFHNLMHALRDVHNYASDRAKAQAK